MRSTEIIPSFVDSYPDVLKEGVIYVSERFSQATHLCCCGCGTQIVTSLKPAKWSLYKSPDGSITIRPSIGNSNSPCKSHYYITSNVVEWEMPMTPASTNRARRLDQADLLRTYGPRATGQTEELEATPGARPVQNQPPVAASAVKQRGLIARLWARFGKWVRDLLD
jgi:hypothetical protein